MLMGMLAFAEGWPAVNLSIQKKSFLKDTSSDLAIIVSIEDYGFLKDIPGATANGKAWENWFQASQKMSADRVVHINGRDAVRSNIIAKINQLVKKTGPSSKVWFVYIGHGTRSKKGGVLLDVATTGNVTDMEERGILYSDILNTLESNGADVVAVLDSCFSGSNREDDTPLVDGLMSVIVIPELETSRTTVFSAGTAKQYAGQLPGVQRPAFSYLMLGALQGWADENTDASSRGKVTAKEAIDYVNTVLDATLIGRKQTPILDGVVDVELSKAVRSSPNLANIKKWTMKHVEDPQEVIDTGTDKDGPKLILDQKDILEISGTTILLGASITALVIGNQMEQQLKSELLNQNVTNPPTRQYGYDRSDQINILYGLGYAGVLASTLLGANIYGQFTSSSVHIGFDGRW